MNWKRVFIACFTVLLPFSAHGQSRGGNATYDFIVIGAGIGGLVIASRLSENPDAQVLVIEAGYSELDNANSSYPELNGDTLSGRLNWKYQTVPQIYADGLSHGLASGRGIGGSSLINGRVYTRADSQQIDAWELAGNEGWNWANLFPYYKKSQQLILPSAKAVAAGATFDESYHGFDGPLHTGWPRNLGSRDYFRALNDSMQARGVPWNHDPAGGIMHGLSTFPRTDTPGNDSFPDVRANAGRSYYYPVQDRPNLHMMTGTTALRILWAAHDQGEAVANAVEVLTDSGRKLILNARKEVIVSAGSYRSPSVLEHSGVGNPQILSKHGIETVVDLPGVGENLMDQVFNVIFFNATPPANYSARTDIVAYLTIEDMYGSEGAASFASEIQAALPKYAKTIASMNNHATSAEDLLNLLKIQYSMIFDSQIPAMELLIGANGVNVSSQMWGTMPFTRGQLHIQSSDPSDLPRVDSRFWQLDYDLDTQIHAARFIRTLYRDTAPLRSLVASEGSPGLAAVPEDAGKETWSTWMKSNFRKSYHPVGTNIMLPREKGGVTSTRCKVYGTANVRVVDASIFTYQTNGHTSANCYAVAERCADLIKEDLGKL